MATIEYTPENKQSQSLDGYIIQRALEMQSRRIKKWEDYYSLRQSMVDICLTAKGINPNTKEFVTDSMRAIEERYPEFHANGFNFARVMMITEANVLRQADKTKADGFDDSQNIAVIRARANIDRINQMYPEVINSINEEDLL
jgi:hypothetical protein